MANKFFMLNRFGNQVCFCQDEEETQISLTATTRQDFFQCSLFLGKDSRSMHFFQAFLELNKIPQCNRFFECFFSSSTLLDLLVRTYNPASDYCPGIQTFLRKANFFDFPFITKKQLEYATKKHSPRNLYLFDCCFVFIGNCYNVNQFSDEWDNLPYFSVCDLVLLYLHNNPESRLFQKLPSSLYYGIFFSTLIGLLSKKNLEKLFVCFSVDFVAQFVNVFGNIDIAERFLALRKFRPTRGLQFDDDFQSRFPSLFAMDDAVGTRAFTSLACQCKYILSQFIISDVTEIVISYLVSVKEIRQRI